MYFFNIIVYLIRATLLNAGDFSGKEKVYLLGNVFIFFENEFLKDFDNAVT